MLQQSNVFHKKQNYLYLGIALIAVLGLLFLFRAYHFHLKYSLQREELLRKQKEEADLQSRLKAEETARLVTEQKLALVQKEQLQKEILAGALQVEHKNEILQNLKEKLSAQPGNGHPAKQIEKIMNEEMRMDEDFENVKSEFKDIHPDFFNRLQEQGSQKLTQLDLKYCAYIYMSFSSKQIASLLHIEPKSVRMARYRLKQKLELGKEDDLEKFIRSFENPMI